MKTRVNLYFVLAGATALFAGYALYSSYHWPFRTALFPRVIGIPLLCLAVAEAICSLLRGEQAREGPAVDFELTSEIDPALARRRTILILAWSLGFFALILVVGFPLAVPLLVLLYLRAVGREGWGLTILLTFFAWLFMEGLFIRLLHVRFPPGWFFSLLHD